MARERLRIAEPEYSLAVRIKREDEQLDAILEETKPKRAIAEANPDGPREVSRKRGESVQWQWRDETQVAHVLADFEGRRSSYAGQNIETIERTQAFGRQLDRARDHVGGGSGGGRSYDPSSFGTAHVGEAFSVWMTLTAVERVVLSAMYGDLVQREDGGPQVVAAKVREFMRAEAEASARDLFSADASVRWDGLELATITPTQLAAIKLGRLDARADAVTKATVTGALSLEVRAARRVFRDRLRLVDVNEHLSRLKDCNGIPRDRRPFLIPPASLKELEAQRAREERVCIGPIELEPLDPTVDVLPAIVAGDRPHCGSNLVVADVSSWPRCEVCRLPKLGVSSD